MKGIEGYSTLGSVLGSPILENYHISATKKLRSTVTVLSEVHHPVHVEFDFNLYVTLMKL